MPLNSRRLESSHFAFYRAYLEGSEALDLPALADRYLDCGRDPRRVRALLRWLQDELAAAARRNGDWEALRLLRLPKYLGQKSDAIESQVTPSLIDFAAEVDPDNVFGEAELIALYRDRHPDIDDRRATKTARLRERRLTALRRLQHITVDAPLPTHSVDGWFDENVVVRMHRAGIVSLQQLCETINGHGVRWYRDIPHLGPIGAARIVRWVQANAISLGDVVPRLRHEPTNGSAGTAIQGRCAIVPLETLAEEGLPNALSGAEGRNRGRSTQPAITASTDVAAVLAWLDAQADSPHTRRAYRTQAERILLWAIVDCGKPLSSLDAHDVGVYRAFMASPPSTWVAPRHTPRWSVRWRPFAGPLTQSSRATASNVLKAMFGWLVKNGYLATDPWRASHEMASDNATADVRDNPRAPVSASAVAAAHEDAIDTRMRLRVERQVGASQWEAVRQYALQSESERDLRAFCMLALSRAAGLRLHELAALHLGDLHLPRDVDASGAVTVVPDGQGAAVQRLAAPRTVAIPSWVVAALQRYLDARGIASGQILKSDRRILFAPIRNADREGRRGADADQIVPAISKAQTPTPPARGAALSAVNPRERRMHPTALTRTISQFLDRVAVSSEPHDLVLAASVRHVRTGDCRHSFLRNALLSATPVVQLQATLGLRSRTTIDAHRRALAASRA